MSKQKSKKDSSTKASIKRENSISSSRRDDMSELGKSGDLSDITMKHLSSTLKARVIDPSEIHTELEKNVYVIPANKRRTSEVMSLFEYVRVKCDRAQQIQNGGQIFVDYEPMMDEIAIAELEIKTKNCPLSIVRQLNENVVEVWAVNEMEIPFE
jgi:DNA-directed RNA polymerase subunit K/omega